MAKRYRFAFKRLDVYQAAVEHFEWTCAVVQRMPRGPFKVIDQAVSASLSVIGNIGEAHGREARSGEAEQHYRYAQGSAFESATHLDALTRLMQKQRKRTRELRGRPGGSARRTAAGRAGTPPVESPTGVAEGAERPKAIEPRGAGPGGSAATGEDRTSTTREAP